MEGGTITGTEYDDNGTSDGTVTNISKQEIMKRKHLMKANMISWMTRAWIYPYNRKIGIRIWLYPYRKNRMISRSRQRH